MHLPVFYAPHTAGISFLRVLASRIKSILIDISVNARSLILCTHLVQYWTAKFRSSTFLPLQTEPHREHSTSPLLRPIMARYHKTNRLSHKVSSLYFWISEYVNRFYKFPKYEISWKIRPAEVALFHADGSTNGATWRGY
jgi:hypothetical protein